MAKNADKGFLEQREGTRRPSTEIPSWLMDTIPLVSPLALKLSKEEWFGKWFENEIEPQLNEDPRIKRALTKLVGEIIGKNLKNLSKIAMAEYVIKYIKDPVSLKKEEREVLMAFSPAELPGFKIDGQVIHKLAKTLLYIEISIDINQYNIAEFIKKTDFPEDGIYLGEYLNEKTKVLLPDGERREVSKMAYFKQLARLRVKLGGMKETDSMEGLGKKLVEEVNKINDELKKANLGRFDAYDAGIFSKLLLQELGFESKLELAEGEALLKVKDPIITNPNQGWYFVKFK